MAGGKQGRLFLASFWTDRDVEQWDPLKRHLNVWLSTNELVTVSGVYYVTIHRMHQGSGVSKEDIERFLFEEPMAGKYGVTYDMDNCVVFVHSRLTNRFGGEPGRVATSIIGDFWATSKAKILWRTFRDVYEEEIGQMPALHDHFFQVAGLDLAGHAVTPFWSKARGTTEKLYTTTQATPEDLETEIQNMLNRYTEELSADDRKWVFSVYDYFTKHRGAAARKLIVPRRRWEILARWAKEPTLLVARAAFEFLEAGCIESAKPLQYFVGVMNGSARSWYDSEMALTEGEKNGRQS